MIGWVKRLFAACSCTPICTDMILAVWCGMMMRWNPKCPKHPRCPK